LNGVARVLRKELPTTRIVVAEPENASLLGSGVAQQRCEDGTPSAGHPHFNPHPIQGWVPDFISSLTEDALTAGHVDSIVPVDANEALELARDLARLEGIFVGISSGATLAAALRLAAHAEAGANILCMLPDTGERYLSTALFEHVNAEMCASELAVSLSTPACQMGSPRIPVALQA